MEKTIRHLGTLLTAQLLLAFLLLSSGSDLTAVSPDTPLFSLDEKTVNRLVIEDGEGKKVVLQKQGTDWNLPDHFGFPADMEKVDGLLKRLTHLNHSTPVATTVGALQRFKVTDQAFERRITLANDSTPLAVLFLGTSPGPRRIHARTAKDQAVFSVDLTAFDAPPAAIAWENKEILTIPEQEIVKIQLSDWSFVRQNPDKSAKNSSAWIGESLAPGVSLKADAVETLVRNLANLRVEEVLGTEPQEHYHLQTPKLRLSLMQKEKGERVYQLGEQKDGNAFILKVSTRPEFFKIAKFTAESLLQATSNERLFGTSTEGAKP